jgi:hypothetical protein
MIDKNELRYTTTCACTKEMVAFGYMTIHCSLDKSCTVKKYHCSCGNIREEVSRDHCNLTLCHSFPTSKPIEIRKYRVLKAVMV